MSILLDRYEDLFAEVIKQANKDFIAPLKKIVRGEDPEYAEMFEANSAYVFLTKTIYEYESNIDYEVFYVVLIDKIRRNILNEEYKMANLRSYMQRFPNLSRCYSGVLRK